MTETSPPSESAASGETVLVVEAEVLARMVLAEYLRDCGYRVVEAASAEEAVTVLEQPDLAVDVVLTDMEMAGEMPGMDGFALARWARSRRPGLEVVLAAGPARAADAAGDLCESGPMLAKPYDPQLVADRIRRLLAERRPAP